MIGILMLEIAQKSIQTPSLTLSEQAFYQIISIQKVVSVLTAGVKNTSLA